MSNFDAKRYDYEKKKDNLMRKSIAVSMLCAVISVSSDCNKVNLQPLIKTEIDGKYESSPPLINVPVLKHRNENGTVVSPVYHPGDIGVVLFCDQDIDNVLLSRSESEPASDRLHSLDDGIFLGVI